MSETMAAAIPFTRPGSEPGINPWFIAITVTLATFMELLDTAIANVSLPHIAGGLAVKRGREHVGADELPFRTRWCCRFRRG